MKRIVFLLAFVVSTVIGANTADAQVAFKVFGATADTLTASDTLTSSGYQLSPSKQNALSIQVNNDYQSGTSSYVLYFQRSNDNVNYNDVSGLSYTLSVTQDTTFFMDTTLFQSPWIRARVIADTNTQKSSPIIFIKTY